jgi:hypothetical protein
MLPATHRARTASSSRFAKSKKPLTEAGGPVLLSNVRSKQTFE